MADRDKADGDRSGAGESRKHAAIEPQSGHAEPEKVGHGADQFEAVFRNAGVGIVVGTADGRVVRANQAVELITGYSEAELIEHGWAMLSHPEELAKTRAFVKDVVDGQRDSYRMEKRYIRKDGFIIWIDIDVSYTRDADGTPDTGIAIIRDINDAVLARQALNTSEARYEEAARLARLGHWDYDEITQINLYQSNVIAEIHELTGDEYRTIHQTMEDDLRAIHPDDRASYEQATEQSYANNTPYEVDYRIITAKGNLRYVREIGVPVFDENGTLISTHGTFQDITESKQAEIALQASEEKRRQAMDEVVRATRAKSEFMASMSHELRTPLNSILGYAEMIEDQYLGPLGNPKYVDYARSIRDSGQHLLALVNDILDIERIEAGKYDLRPEQFDVHTLMVECQDLLTHRAEQQDVSVTVEATEDLPPLLADRRAILQIMINLATNAVKFTLGGGHVRLSATASNRHHRLVVSDTGVGIPETILPSLADPFTRHIDDPHKSQDGVGLGLAICKSLVDLHSGTLTIESTLGKGTAVTVTLPSDGATNERLI